MRWSACHAFCPISRLQAEAVTDLVPLDHPVAILRLTLVPEHDQADLSIDAELVFDRVVRLLDLIVRLEYLLVEHVLAKIQCAPVADRALPTLVLRVDVNVVFKVEALQVQAVLTSSRLLNRDIGERTGRVQRDHGRLLGFLDSDVRIDLFLALEELLGPRER